MGREGTWALVLVNKLEAIEEVTEQGQYCPPKFAKATYTYFIEYRPCSCKIIAQMEWPSLSSQCLDQNPQEERHSLQESLLTGEHAFCLNSSRQRDSEIALNSMSLH